MRNRKRTGWHQVHQRRHHLHARSPCCSSLIPLYWLIASSFKNPNAIGRQPAAALGPTPFSGANYPNAFVSYDFGIYFRNSLIVTLVATALVLILGTLAGYALGRLPMRGKFTTDGDAADDLGLPGGRGDRAAVPAACSNLGWLNSYQALILPYTAFNLPFAIWILRNYMLGIPKEMEETGRIDGAGPLRTVWTIILPMALPGLFTAGIFCFTACWTEFLMALTFNSANNYRTIPVGIADVRRELPGPVRDHLRRQRGGGGAHRHPGLHLPQVRHLRPDLGRGEGMSRTGNHGHAPGKESSWPR